MQRSIKIVSQVALVEWGKSKWTAGHRGNGERRSVYGRDRQRETQRITYILICPWSSLHTTWLKPFWQQILKFYHGLPCLITEKKKKMSFGELPVMRFDIFCSVEIIGHRSCIHYVNISILEKTMNTIEHKFLKSWLFNVSFFQEIAESSSYSLSMSLVQSMSWQLEGYVLFSHGLQLQNMIFTWGFIK